MVSTKEDIKLNFQTDLFVSKIVSKNNLLKRMTKTIKSKKDLPEEMHLLEDQLILTREVKNSVIIQETLSMIDNMASNKEKKELLDKLFILSAVIYPKSSQCTSLDDFVVKVKNHSKNKSKSTKYINSTSNHKGFYDDSKIIKDFMTILK